LGLDIINGQQEHQKRLLLLRDNKDKGPEVWNNDSKSLRILSFFIAIGDDKENHEKLVFKDLE
jgi:hypothetical protein